MHTPAALSVLFRLQRTKKEYHDATNHPQFFLHINGTREILVSAVVIQMQCVSLTNKTNKMTLKRKALSMYELPSKLINFYTLTDARTVSPCNVLLQPEGLSVMALDVLCVSKGLMWEMQMSE
jgi:hypothetical protein